MWQCFFTRTDQFIDAANGGQNGLRVRFAQRIQAQINWQDIRGAIHQFKGLYFKDIFVVIICVDSQKFDQMPDWGRSTNYVFLNMSS
jgi:hypothetical protein